MGALRPSSPSRVLARERAAKVVTLRVAGVTETAIANSLGITQGRVSQILKKELAKLSAATAASTDTLRALQHQRYEAIIQRHTTRSLPEKADPRHSELVMKAQAGQAKLHGLDAPSKIESTGKDGQPLHPAAPPALMFVFDDLAAARTATG